MNIAKILELDDDIKGLSCSGIVTYTKEASHKTGEYNGEPYSFWTQFIVLKDASADIGINLNLGDSDINAVAKGQNISVVNGIVGSYIKDNKTRKSLRATIRAQNQQQDTQTAPQAANVPNCQPSQKELCIIAASTALQGTFNNDLASTEGIASAIIDLAEILATWCMTGQEPNMSTGESRPKDDIPF